MNFIEKLEKKLENVEAKMDNWAYDAEMEEYKKMKLKSKRKKK